MTKKIEIYTDGSCNNKPESRKGGWGVVMVFNGETITMFGRVDNTSSNRMEMTAIIAGLQKLNGSKLHVDEVDLYSDSQYSLNIFRGKWNASINLDLVEQYEEVKKSLLAKGTKIRLHWVRGHAGNQYNEMADQLANYKTQQEEQECPKTITLTMTNS